jgi:hypothetical protein
MSLTYYAGFFAGAFMVFRFEGFLEFMGCTLISLCCVAETARAMTEKRDNCGAKAPGGER